MGIDNEIEDTNIETPEVVEADDKGGNERVSIRESLERGFATAKEEAAQAEKGEEKRDRKTGRFAPEGVKSKRSGEVEEKPVATEGAEAPEAPQTEAKPVGDAPIAWPKEAKEVWAQLPPTVQAAVLKREADTQKGVDALKANYAEVDGALAPHMDAIKRHGHTPGQAVNQLFSWFEALAKNPNVAFPALAKSFNYSMPAASAPAATAPVAGAEPKAEAQPDTAVPPAVQQYIDGIKAEMLAMKQELGQQVNGLTSTFAQQSEQKTQEVVNNWAKDKPHFETVRGLMAQLINSGAVPLKDGRVDLDGAYEMAVWSNPEVRVSVLQAEQAKKEADAKAKVEQERKAQEAAALAAKGRRVSITGSAPGVEVSKKVTPKGTSVKDSLRAAISEVRGA